MNRLFTVLALLLTSTAFLRAANGDTTKVRVFDKFSMNRYGTFDKKAKLPDAAKKYQRIWLKYTLGCESNGQCEWDYTLKLFFREHTGTNDSTLKQAPRIKLAGSIPDSVSYSSDTTWINTFNATTKGTDSMPAGTITVFIYGDSLHPLVLTDSLKGFAANFYRYSFDSTGKKTDSVWVAATNLVRQKYTPYYEVFEVVNDMELGRFISPYAKTFPKNFQYEYVYDVTDFAYLFAASDSAELRIEYQGYSYGFTATWDMIYVEGTPARDVIAIKNVYNGGYDYGQSVSIEEKLNAKSFTVPQGTDAVKARVIITGHGGENSANCAEFCPRSYFLKLNNLQIAEELVWKDDCGANAIVAQPGTWVYNRANWCPGEKIRVFEYPLNVAAGSTNTIDMDFQPFTANGYAGYNLSMQLVYYKANNFENDAAIEDILAPSKNFWYSKTNPVCDNAKIVLKNWGSKPLTRALISTQVSNGPVNTQQWAGNLAYGQQEEVALTMIWPGGLADSTYKVWLSSVNSNPTDENEWNNAMRSEFSMPLTLPQRFVIETRTNGRPADNSYTITDSYGKTHKDRSFTTAGLLHRDTINIGYGCYTFKFNDESGNGIDWWAAPGDGKGTCRIVTAEGSFKVLRTFSPDFGSFFQLNFRVQHPVGLDDIKEQGNNINVYPNPANNVLFVEGIATGKTAILDVTGKLIMEFNYTESGMDVKNIPAGIYLLQITGGQGETFVRKITITK